MYTCFCGLCVKQSETGSIGENNQTQQLQALIKQGEQSEWQPYLLGSHLLAFSYPCLGPSRWQRPRSCPKKHVFANKHSCAQPRHRGNSPWSAFFFSHTGQKKRAIFSMGAPRSNLKAPPACSPESHLQLQQQHKCDPGTVVVHAQAALTMTCLCGDHKSSKDC